MPAEHLVIRCSRKLRFRVQVSRKPGCFFLCLDGPTSLPGVTYIPGEISKHIHISVSTWDSSVNACALTLGVAKAKALWWLSCVPKEWGSLLGQSPSTLIRPGNTRGCFSELWALVIHLSIQYIFENLPYTGDHLNWEDKSEQNTRESWPSWAQHLAGQG